MTRSKTQAGVVAKQSPASTPAQAPTQTLAHITRVAKAPAVPEKDLSGIYRVIHGHVEVPRPESEWHDAAGNELPHEPKTVTAEEGDEVWLPHADAKRLLAMHIEPELRPLHAVVETLDTRPSRVGKVWRAPAPARNRNPSTYA